MNSSIEADCLKKITHFNNILDFNKLDYDFIKEALCLPYQNLLWLFASETKSRRAFKINPINKGAMQCMACIKIATKNVWRIYCPCRFLVVVLFLHEKKQECVRLCLMLILRIAAILISFFRTVDCLIPVVGGYGSWSYCV